VAINEAAGFTGFMPLASIVLSVIILHESIAAGHIMGMALVLLGIYIIVLKKKKKPENKKVTGDLAN
jgi:drug/metabolite transporter (DMT)-like permease